ncbi:MAG: hypothetical protein ACOYUZ_06430 [Patescibacteria group bacterium]
MKKGFLLLLTAVLIAGAGCAWFVKENSGPRPAGPYPADFDGVSSEEAAKRVNLVPGSQIEIRKLVNKDGQMVVDKSDLENKEGTRIITIKRFAPLYYSNLNWKLSQNIGDERQSVAGSINNLDFNKSHDLFFPAYWPTEDIEISDNGGIWLSKETYQEITTTKNSTIYFNILNSLLYDKLSSSPEFSMAIKALEADVSNAKKTVDTDLVQAEQEMTDWTLRINGEDVKVQVIKARNWFGEIVILNNIQNPLILKLTFDPQKTENLTQETGLDLLKNLLSYEVVQLDGVQ